MKTNKGQTATVYSMPAPIGGLNARDPAAMMAITDAAVMTNWFPEEDGVSIRGGYVIHSSPTGITKTLSVYRGNTVNKMFAAAGSVIYDVTTAGVATSVVTGLTSSVFQWCQMGTIGGRFLMMFNGVDNAQYFDGTTWTATSFGVGATQIAGVDPRNIINCNIYKNRLYLVEKNSANVWYLPVNSVYGTANKLDLSSVLKQGSTIVAMATWTIDNSGGVQEYAVFISNNGEIVTYQGSDPSVATDFKIAARFFIAKPVGYRCYVEIASDVIILCSDGVIPISKALLTDRTQAQIAVTDKISDLIQQDYAAWVANGSPDPDRWGMTFFPDNNKLILNIAPITGSGAIQYVMNTRTGAWCKFVGWNAYCFVVFQSQLYFGKNNSGTADGVSRADVPFVGDNNNAFIADCQQAFSNLDNPSTKFITSIRPIVSTTSSVDPMFFIDVDFKTNNFNNNGWYTSINTTSASPRITVEWQSMSRVCKFIAMRGAFTKGGGAGVYVKWQSTDVMYKKGGLL